MKINMPVTTHEVLMPEGRPIVSKTDIKGIITYANQTFLDISGYSREELIGKNHNIVRHPDMPPEAFAWLWDTLKQDLPWRGVVKNRCKNGDFYWVEACVTPLKENGRTVGYMSVRNIPNRNEVAACEALYRAIREKRATLPKRSFRFDDLSFLMLMKVVFVLIALLLGGATLYLLARDNALVERLIAAIFGASSLLVLGAGYWLGTSIQSFLKRLGLGLSELAKGNFTFSIRDDARNEFGRLLNDAESMRINLRAIIADVTLTTKEVDAAARTVEAEMRALLDRIHIQSDHVNSTSAAMEEMLRSIMSAQENTGTSAEIAKKTMNTVADGGKRMESSVASVQHIVNAVGESRATITNLRDLVQRIDQLTLTIRDVADQTNLLALNAAIEAARAGEQGRGFAVVADEVRKLAERTSGSTKDISNTVSAIHQATSAAGNMMEQTVSEVSRSTALINESSRSLEEILSASRQTMAMIDQMSIMQREQADAINGVANSMNVVHQLETDNVNSIRNTGSRASRLALVSSELQDLIKHFEKSL
ncbi:MAG: methyl-accepting chemotaxis protein [Azonexus sp.]|jgi:aerotaxis receptor|nr:methyl-accepting chemotaxis protein [Azonexus sp.]